MHGKDEKFLRKHARHRSAIIPKSPHIYIGTDEKRRKSGRQV